MGESVTRTPCVKGTTKHPLCTSACLVFICMLHAVRDAFFVAPCILSHRIAAQWSTVSPAGVTRQVKPVRTGVLCLTSEPCRTSHRSSRGVTRNTDGRSMNNSLCLLPCLVFPVAFAECT